MNTETTACLISRLDPADWPAQAPFILQHNRCGTGHGPADAQPRCLHAHQGDTLAQHADELAALPADEAAFWIASTGDRTDGLIGCEFDPELRRAWLRGPLTGPAAPADLASDLLRTLEAALPAMQCFDAFPTEADEALNALYAAAGYQRQAVHRVMEAALDGPDAPDPAPGEVQPADASMLGALLSLHGELFPAGYLKDSDFEMARSAADRLLLASMAGGRCIGYLHAKDEPAQGEIYVDYVGVAAEARGQGLGRALLLQALDWGRRLGRRRASLTVREDRAPALTLYLRLGFVQVSAGAHWRKERDVAGAPG